MPACNGTAVARLVLFCTTTLLFNALRGKHVCIVETTQSCSTLCSFPQQWAEPLFSTTGTASCLCGSAPTKHFCLLLSGLLVPAAWVGAHACMYGRAECWVGMPTFMITGSVVLMEPRAGSAADTGVFRPPAFFSAAGAIFGQTSVHAVEELWLPLENLSSDAPGAAGPQCALKGVDPCS
jgi:hypothetical protein